jgi:hypothetical protein
MAEATMTADQVTAYLGHVRALIKTSQSKPGDTETEHAIVADLFPGFVAAVDAALSRHVEAVIEDMPDPFRYCKTCSGHPAWPCPEVAAITTALAEGKAGDDS